jgi:hypothetical protein
MSSAQEKVFGTVELIELIFSHLSLRDLLAAQRVNFLCNQIIRRHSRIRKAQYLLPDTSISVSSLGYADTNPLFLQRFVQQAALYALQQLNPAAHFRSMDRFVRHRQKSFADPQANWKEMVLFQPPVEVAMLRSMSPHYDDWYHYIKNKEGLKMGDVVEFFAKQAACGGVKAVEMLSATVTRKVVWSVTPITDLTA